MKRQKLSYLLVNILFISFFTSQMVHAQADTGNGNPIFVVFGNVTDAKGAKAADGLFVVVTNETKSLRRVTQIGADSPPGSYTVSFVELGETAVVTVGDVFNASVRGPKGPILGEASQVVSEEDVRQAKTVIDIQFHELTTSQQPTTPDETRSPIFVVVGKVTDRDGTEVESDVRITVTNETKSLTQETQSGVGAYKGSYLASFVALDETYVVSIGDAFKVIVWDPKGPILGESSHVVTQEEVRRAKAAVNVRFGMKIPKPSANKLPMPAFAPNIFQGLAPLTITLDASNSKDLDGTITKYEWDWESDGKYDAEGIKQTHTYTAAGTFKVTLRVTDSSNATSIKTLEVKVNPSLSEFSITDIRIGLDDLRTDGLTLEIFVDNLKDVKDIKMLFYTDSPDKPIPAKVLKGSNSVFAVFDKVPSVSENIKSRITEINGNKTNIESSITVSSCYVTNNKGEPYNVVKHGYRFRNPTFSFIDLKGWWANINDNPFLTLNPLTVLIPIIAQWNGRCFGMAATSNLYFQDPSLRPIARETGFMEKSDPGVLQNIIHYHMPQIFSKPVSRMRAGTFGTNDMKEFVKTVKGYLRSNNPVLMLISTEKKEGHAVSVYRLIEDSSKDKAYIYLYDSNIEGKVRTAVVDIKNNRFEYTSLTGDYVYTKAEAILARRILSDKEIITEIGKLIKQNISNLWSRGVDAIGLGSPATMLVTNIKGQRMGFIDGESIINEIPNGEIYTIDDGNGYKAQVFYVPSNLEYKVVYFGKAQGTMNIEIVEPQPLGNTIIRSYNDIPITPKTVASLSVSEKSEFVLKVDINNDGSVDNIINPKFKEFTPPPMWDVNDDGVVDILDLVLVGSAFGISGKGLSTDINNDGNIDILDLVLIGIHFGEKYNLAGAAPVFDKIDWRKLKIDYSWFLPLLEKIYMEFDKIPNTSAGFIHTKFLLQELIALARGQRIPTKTKLLQNYPNPFNPETWIPYELSEESHVIIRIYNTVGALIRKLDIGQQPAGYYHHTPSKAVYWDGRNEQGEFVASGIYFYTIQAGNFVATRRMVIIK